MNIESPSLNRAKVALKSLTLIKYLNILISFKSC